MAMSRQTAFTLMLLLAFSVIVPGSAGYLSVKMEAIGQAHRELLTLESRLRDQRLSARIRKMERIYRNRRLQPVASSGREACEPARRSRGEPERRPPGPGEIGPGEIGPVPVGPIVERVRERRLRAQREDAQRQNAERVAQWEAQRPEAQRLTAQSLPEAGMSGDAFPQEQPWSRLERRGGIRGYPAETGEAPEEPALVAPDVIGDENPGQDTGKFPEEGLPSEP